MGVGDRSSKLGTEGEGWMGCTTFECEEKLSFDDLVGECCDLIHSHGTPSGEIRGSLCENNNCHFPTIYNRSCNVPHMSAW